MDQPAYQNATARRDLTMQRTGSQPIILVVEDYADSRHMLKLLLEDQNYAVLTAANGKVAIVYRSPNSD